jgi:hypothetical protein
VQKDETDFQRSNNQDRKMVSINLPHSRKKPVISLGKPTSHYQRHLWLHVDSLLIDLE